MFKSKSVIIVAIATLLLTGGVGTYSVIQKNDAKVAFSESGYMIDGDEELENGFAKYTFNAGDKMEFHYPDKVVFKDAEKAEVVAEAASFLHYNDGSISALNQSVLIDLNDLNAGMLNYYNLTSGATLENQGGSYALETRDTSMYFKDFLWKIGEKKYLLASDEITITMADQQTLEFKDYVELKYYNEGILLILSEDGAYRTVSSDCIATVENGMQVDLASRTVLAQESVLMSMEQMVIGSDDNIDVLAPIKAAKGEDKVRAQQMQIHVPTFEVIDGADGINGEQGIDGTKGKTGAEGAAGVSGMDGLAGAEGLMGEDGIDGTHGTPGTPGTAGTPGMAGANGASGASGGAGATGATGSKGSNGLRGEDGKDGDDVALDGSGEGEEKEVIALPVFRWNEATEITSNSVKMAFTIDLNDATASLLASVDGSDDITIKLVNNATGREVNREIRNSTAEQIIEFTFDNLAADTEYRVVVNASYRVYNGTYEKTFLTKTFTTSALGVSFVKQAVTENSLSFAVYKSGYSNVESMDLVLADVSGNIIGRTQITDADFADPTQPPVVTFVSGEDGVLEITSNTVYQVYLDQVSDGTHTFTKVGTQQCRTLKQTPTIGKPIVLVNKVDSVFDMYLDGVTDKDSGIQYYRYELYDCENGCVISDTTELVKTLYISTNKVVPCEVTQEMRYKTYRVRVVASFYDNEKTVEIASTTDSEPFALLSDGFPIVTYEADEAQTKHDHLVGTIKIEDNGVAFQIDNQHPITVYYKSSSGVTKQVFYDAQGNGLGKYNLTDEDGKKTYTLPVNFDGLCAADNYIITVWAWTDLGEPTESAADAFLNRQIGTVIVTTPTPAGLSVTLESNPAANASMGFSLRLTSADPSEPADYEASTIERIVVNVYDGDKLTPNSTATLVASTTVNATPGTAANRNSSLGADVYGDDKKITLTEDNFDHFNPSMLSGNTYTVEVAAVQDYTQFPNSFSLKAGTTMKVLEKEKTPPTWKDVWATDGIVATPIYNSAESLQANGVTDFSRVGSLPETAVIGIKVETRYDNSAGLATEFQYYAYEVGDNNATDCDTFYADSSKAKAVITRDYVEGNTGVASAVFLFKDIDPSGGKLTRGHHYFFTGRVEISNSKYFPDAFVASKPVMRSKDMDVPYLKPEFKFSQYKSDGAGNLTYHYWIDAKDGGAVVGDFVVTGGTPDNRIITKDGTMGTLALTNITSGRDVTVKCKVREYDKDSGEEKELIKQVVYGETGITDYVYEMTDQTSRNRLSFEVRPKDESISKAALDRMTAMQVNIWKFDDETSKKTYTIPFTMVTDGDATAYLNYSELPKDFIEQPYTLRGTVSVLYDTNVSGMHLAEGSGAGFVAIQKVDIQSGNTRYITLNTTHSDIKLSDHSNAWNSLFTVTKQSDVKKASLAFTYRSPLDTKYNVITEEKKLSFAAQELGTLVAGPEVVATLKEIGEAQLQCSTSGGYTDKFEFKVEKPTPSIDLWSGDLLTIVPTATSATVHFKLTGHDVLMANNTLTDKTMYIGLYEQGVNGSTVIIPEDRSSQSADGTVRYTPASLVAGQTQYFFDITGLSVDTTYQIHFYLVDNNGTKVLPLDVREGSPLYYSFSTATAVSLEVSSVSVNALTYRSKYVEIQYKPSHTTGFHVKYEFAKKNGSEYTTLLDSDALERLGVIETRELIAEEIEEFFYLRPGTLKWMENGVEKQFTFGESGYYLLMTPVSPADHTVPLGEATPVDLYFDEQTEPFYKVTAKPGKVTENGNVVNYVEFKISIQDSDQVIYENQYMLDVLVNGSSFEVEGLNQESTYHSNNTKTIRVKGLQSTDTVTLKLYAAIDLNNDGIVDDMNENGSEDDALVKDTAHNVKTVQAKPLGDISYDLGEMSMQSLGNGKAALYFTNAVGLEDGCPITSIIYSVAQTNGGGTPGTYTQAFRPAEVLTDTIWSVELGGATFASGTWYTVYVKFLGNNGKSLEEATFSYKG